MMPSHRRPFLPSRPSWLIVEGALKNRLTMSFYTEQCVRCPMLHVGVTWGEVVIMEPQLYLVKFSSNQGESNLNIDSRRVIVELIGCLKNRLQPVTTV